MGVSVALLAEIDAAFPRHRKLAAAKPDPSDRRPVCVTSAASFLGAALIRTLLRRGFAVRIAIDAEGNAEKLAECCEELAFNQIEELAKDLVKSLGRDCGKLSTSTISIDRG